MLDRWGEMVGGIPFQQTENQLGKHEHLLTFVHQNQFLGHRISWGVPKAEHGNAQALLLADRGGTPWPTRTTF